MNHVFLCDLTHTGQKIASDCFPYGIGCIAAYVEKNFRFPTAVHLFKFANEIYEALVKSRPRIVGFSNYAWNFNLAISVAECIKALFPETVIVFGGPNFPKRRDEQAEFMRASPVIDFYIEGEGEQAFLYLVERLYEHKFDLESLKHNGSPSVRTILNGQFLTFDLIPRLKSLDEVPSPYLTGKLDKFFGQNLMPLIQTNRGCPFSCTYCVEGGHYYKRVVKRSERQVIADEMEYIAKRAMDNRQMFLADSNFGMYSEDVETAQIIGRTMNKWDYPTYIHVATGKNRKDRVLEVARALKGRLRLSGSVQTLDPVVLSNIKRKNISGKQLLDLAKDGNKVGANSYSEVILGLPGDSLGAHMRTMKGVIEAGFNFALPWTLMLLMGSELFGRDARQRFGFERKHRVLPRCFGIYEFGNSEFMCGEIEEVCVSGQTLSLEDYLECRLFALTTALFYNDRIFEEALETLKSLSLSPFEWLTIIHNSRDGFPEKLRNICENFKKDTLGELWDSKEALLDYMCRPENMRKYISGELGFNVLYTYRTKALVSCMKELNDVAFDTLEGLIAEKASDIYERDGDYLEQIRQFSLLRKDRLFDFGYAPEHIFDFDFNLVMIKGLWGKRSSAKTGRRYTHRFYPPPEKVRFVEEQMDVFGSDEAGLSKVISRIPISKLYRCVDVTVEAS